MRGTKGLAIGCGLIVFLAGVAFAAAEAAGGLDGKTFEVTVVDTGSGEEQSDTLIFKDGTFDSVGCREYGFGAAPYRAEKEGEAWSFSSETHSEKEGVAVWKGTVTGDKIEGTMEWSKPGQDTIRYRFGGWIAP